MVSSFVYVLAAPLLVQAARRYNIVNNCPSTISVFINGNGQGPVPSGDTITRTFNNNFSGLIYSNANGGSSSGSGTTRAGFYGPDDYYYIVKDSTNFNTGINITPINRPSQFGFCVSATCNSLTCNNAYSSPPTGFPAQTGSAPTPPLYECPTPNTGYTVTFCPTGLFPPVLPPVNKGTTINPNGNNNKCLDVRGAVFANGTPVQIYDCNGSGAQNWIVNRGNTKVQVAGTNFCLDAGSSPGNGVGMKIWTCYSGLAAQAWYYTDDNRIALTGQGQCLDLTGGNLSNGNRIQTWQCTNGNNNQVWT
ncbi:G-X-X-X-Q-X-W domain-containing protein [Collybia nuda]|uniref:G-X-X-X-Q-X-W domain-containing protein n=1 Tax=Collybia nuda TaxID=64659 RepID=A0A9P5XV50_9AGAR|nr:G-X-X-X-Q-X-W domain-containing protein [Collybia nuda]